MAVGVQKAWSLSASANGSSDTNINWAQGQLAPTVNDSARATMAAIKAAWNQLAGGCVYSGAGNAYTITSDSVGAISGEYAAGMIFMLKANATNSGAATLNVDGVGAVAITTNDGGALVAGDIVSGGLYLLAYNTTGPRFEIVGSIAGGSFQPLDATLTALAALIGASGQIIRYTGVDTFTLDDTSTTGRSLWNIADAAAGRSALGLGNVENKSSATIRSEISSGNVTGALGYTPYNATNPNGYISNVVTALGYTPYNATNPNGYISNVVTALGYTPWNAAGGGSIGASISVSGDITASGNVSAYSDRTLKKDVEQLTGALDRVCRMEGVSFTVKKTGERGIGFIAQDLEDIQPLLVRTDENGIKSVIYGNTVAELVEAIKELRAEVQRLGGR